LHGEGAELDLELLRLPERFGATEVPIKLHQALTASLKVEVVKKK
jgi:ribosomal protein L9